MKALFVLPTAAIAALVLGFEPGARGASTPAPTTAEAQAEAIQKYPELGKAGSAFNVEFVSRVERYRKEKPEFFTNAAWPLTLADEVGESAKAAPAGQAPGKAVVADDARPEIEFKVLLIIKRESDTYSPLFLPIRARMTDAEVANARRCFEIETPDMVHEITHGKVRFVPTVLISEKPLRIFDRHRLDSAEYYPPELLDEIYPLIKPGDFDSVGYYFLHYDAGSGYKIPRMGYGVGGFDTAHALGMFAINCTPRLNPRDEVFLHEWMHGLDGFYWNKSGVKLPKGTLHGAADHGYREKPWHAGDTFRGWMEWYRDYFNREIREGDQFAGLGDAAWQYGPMRLEAPKLAANYRAVNLPTGTYPAWVYELMKGDLSDAVLGPPLLEKRLDPGDITKASEIWHLETWDAKAGTKAQIAAEDGGTFVIDSPAPNDAAVLRTAPLEAYRNYMFSAEVRTEGVEIDQKGGQYAVNLYAGDSTSTRNLAGTTSWTSIVLPFTTGAKPDACRLKLAVGGVGSVAHGRAFFKNVQVRKVGYPAADLEPP